MIDFLKESKRGKEPKGDAKYHNTWLLLRKYREVVWSMELSVSQARGAFRREFGMTVEEYLDSMYLAGADLSDSKLEDRAQGIQMSYDMLKLLDGAIDLMRTKHYRGEEYYWILYYTYLSPQIIGSVDDIVESLRPHMKDVSRRTYYRKRRESIEILSSLLWGYADRETTAALEEMCKER